MTADTGASFRSVMSDGVEDALAATAGCVETVSMSCLLFIIMASMQSRKAPVINATTLQPSTGSGTGICLPHRKCSHQSPSAAAPAVPATASSSSSGSRRRWLLPMPGRYRRTRMSAATWRGNTTHIVHRNQRDSALFSCCSGDSCIGVCVQCCCMQGLHQSGCSLHKPVAIIAASQEAVCTQLRHKVNVTCSPMTAL